MDPRTMAEKYKSELMKLYSKSTSGNISGNSGISDMDGSAENIQENNSEPADETKDIQESSSGTSDTEENTSENIPKQTENDAESEETQPDNENFQGLSDHDSAYFPYTGDEGGEFDAGSMARAEEYAVAEYPTQKSMGDSTGYIIVNVRAGRDAYPIEGAAVVISAAVDGQRLIVAAGETDISGTTLRFSVPAPNESYSQIPDSRIRPYNLFDITVTAIGYEDSRNTDIYVFPDITSIQNINLIPEII